MISIKELQLTDHQSSIKELKLTDQSLKSVLTTMGVRWSDVFYPDNPERRRKVIQLSQQLYDSMSANFRATNRFMDFLNRHVKKCKLTHIKVDEEMTLEQNSKILIAAIEKIQAIVERVDRHLKEKLDPGIYRKLRNIDLSFRDRISTAENSMHVVATVAATAAAIAVCVAIASFGVLAPVVAVIGIAATSSMASVAVGAFAVFAVDAFVGAITGAIERENLEKAIDDMEKLQAKFIPASNDYTIRIYEVLAEYRMHKK